MPVSLPAGVGLTALAPGVTGAGSYNGLGWGPGTDYHIGALTPVGGTSVALLGGTGLTGLNDMPALSTSDALRGQDHGAWGGIDLLQPRTLHLELQIIAADNASMYSDIALAEIAFQPRMTGDLPLLLFDNQRLINCRVRRRSVPYDTGNKPRVGGLIVELVARDPRVYDATQATLTLVPGAGGGGAVWPWVWPVSWGGPSSGGTAIATNLGNFPTRPLITIQGACSNPFVSNGTTGQTLAFQIALANSDVLMVDLDARTVQLNGTASRRSTLVAGSSWWELAPGNSSVTFGASSVATGCSASITFRSAWA